MAEVLGLGTFVAQALLVAVEHDVVFADAAWDILLAREIDGLVNVADIADVFALAESARQFDGGLLAHTVGDHIGP